jgi:CBS domain-containing protein
MVVAGIGALRALSQEAPMRVQDLMTPAPSTCRLGDSASMAARIMWERDCGIVPIVDASDRVVGVVTDRDLCMAAYFQGAPLSQIPLESCMTQGLAVVRPEDDLARAERLMSDRQVKRVPVIDDNGLLVGILSLGDVARRLPDGDGQASGRAVLLAEGVAQTVAAISQPRQ